MEQTTRDQFLADMAVIFKCDGDAFSVAREYYNQHKNYGAATALLFGLSWRTHKEWLQRAAEYWRANDDGQPIDNAWLEAFQTHYVTEVEKYPEDG